MKRVTDAVKSLAADLKRHKDIISDEYVSSEDFEELLEEGLKRISSERNDTKRTYYKNILLAAAKKSDVNLYNEQLVFLNLLERLLPVHLDILGAIYSNAKLSGPVSSSRFGNLQANSISNFQRHSLS